MTITQSKLTLARLRLSLGTDVDYLAIGLKWAEDAAAKGEGMDHLSMADRVILTLAEELEHTREVLAKCLE